MRNSPIYWALDFGGKAVVALAAQEKVPGEWMILGKGESVPAGVEKNEIKKMTDVVEAMFEALKKAEKTSGLSCQTFYYNVDDPQMASVKPRGVKALAGEGQIRHEDVREAIQNSLRMITDFERKPIYSRPLSYVIDDKDLVANPVGIFGHRLDVVLCVLLARSF